MKQKNNNKTKKLNIYITPVFVSFIYFCLSLTDFDCFCSPLFVFPYQLLLSTHPHLTNYTRPLPDFAITKTSALKNLENFSYQLLQNPVSSNKKIVRRYLKTKKPIGTTKKQRRTKHEQNQHQRQTD